MDFDQTRLYYSHQQLQPTREAADEEPDDVFDDEVDVDLEAVQRHFREFLRECRPRNGKVVIHGCSLSA